MKNVTVVGGGTGTFVVLSGLKNTSVNLSVIVNMMDSGGSTGRLRDQYGVLPPGDLRQCLVALSDAPELWRKLFLYRFDGGDLDGHNFGNIFLSALEKTSANYTDVIKSASFVLKTKGAVIPVTFKQSHLVVQYKDGTILKGEGKIDVNFKETSGIERAYLDPEVEVNPEVITQLTKSDFIIIGPGDLYTSIIPILLIDSVAEKIVKSKAKIIYIMNLMTKSGQTTNYSALDHLRDLQKYLHRSSDYVILNNENIPEKIVDWYSANNEKIVEDDMTSENFKGIIIREGLVDVNEIEKEKGDALSRSIVRHNPVKLTKILKEILES
ncbi:MAG: YvcK family protein [bacterium]|nr:YvcK family protein [bacterium]